MCETGFNTSLESASKLTQIAMAVNVFFYFILGFVLQYLNCCSGQVKTNFRYVPIVYPQYLMDSVSKLEGWGDEMYMIRLMHMKHQYVVISGASIDEEANLAFKYAKTLYINEGYNFLWINCSTVENIKLDFRRIWMRMERVGRKTASKMEQVFQYFHFMPTVIVFEGLVPKHPLTAQLDHLLGKNSQMNVIIISNENFEYGEKFALLNLANVIKRGIEDLAEHMFNFVKKYAHLNISVNIVDDNNGIVLKKIGTPYRRKTLVDRTPYGKNVFSRE